jgi:aminoglycoside phosphotransferase (APT) family kinase protein
VDAGEVVITTERLGTLTLGQIQAALDRFHLGLFVSAQLTADGLFGQNVFVTTDSGAWVLRGAPHYDWQFPTERYFARFLHERTDAPTPWPYHLDQTVDIFGWPYVFMPRMPGHSFTEDDWFATLSMNDRIAIAAALGVTLAGLHAATVPVAGGYDPATDSVIPFPKGYGEWVVERIKTLLAEALTYARYTTPEDAAAVQTTIVAGRNALAEPYQPCVVMEDYQPGNVTITGGPGRWRVGGVFDLMTLRFGDGEADLARLGRMYAYEEPQLAQAFISTYLERRPPRPGFERRFPIYLLHDSLIIWTFCLRRNDIWWPQGYTLRAWIEETLGILRGQSLIDG